MMIEDVAVVVPAYCPDDKLFHLVRALASNFENIIIVDDGSPQKEVFQHIAALKLRSILLLHHNVNKGKGAALKTGFSHAMKLAGIKGIVTADADGQHKTEDIVRVAQECLRATRSITLGCRRFSGKVPLRSRLGNICTKFVFRALTGLSVSDTQTGLRGIPLPMLARMLDYPGDRYEYEIEMLADKRNFEDGVREVSIETIYEDNNRCSHFCPIQDSYRIYKALLKAVFAR